MQCHHLDLHISYSTSQFDLSQLNETKERKTKLTQHIAEIHSRRSDHFYYTLTVLIKLCSRAAVFTTTFHTIDVVDDTFFERKKTLRAGIRSQFLLTTLIDVAEDLAIFMAPRGQPHSSGQYSGGLLCSRQLAVQNTVQTFPEHVRLERVCRPSAWLTCSRNGDWLWFLSAEPGVPKRSPIQVLSRPNVA